MASKARELARGVMPASTAARASVKIAPGVAPTSPAPGDMWRVGDDIFVYSSGKAVKLNQLVDEERAFSIATQQVLVFG